MNTWNGIGNIGTIEELKYFDSGSCALNFSVAINEYRKDKDDITHWINCKAWNKTAENISQFFTKGSKIGITGRLNVEQWEKDGNKRSKMIVIVDNFDFCTKKEDNLTNSNEIDKDIVQFDDSGEEQDFHHEIDESSIPF